VSNLAIRFELCGAFGQLCEPHHISDRRSNVVFGQRAQAEFDRR
jgi:hypothetical protein